MTRPTPEQVHHAMTRAEGWRFMGSETIMPGTGWEKFEVLAAEVLALRLELKRTPAIAQAAATLQRNVDTVAHNMVIAQRDEALAAIARVEELAISWGFDPYAKALKAALKGGV